MSWPTVKLGEVITQLRGVTYSSGDAIDSPKEGYVELLRANNIHDGEINFNNVIYVPKSKVSDKQYLKENDILIAASSGSINLVGKAGAVRQTRQCSFGAFCKVIRPSNKIDARYIANFFQTAYYRKKISALAEGANINNLRSEHIDNLLIPMPPLLEQQRIAAILDKAQEIKGKRELAATKLGMLSKEIFADMFANFLEKPNTTLGSIFDVRDGTHDSPKSQTQGYPLVTSKNLNNNTINFENVSFINLEDFEAINKRSKVDYCDILMPMIGTIGNPIIVHDKTPQFAIKNVALIKTGNLDASYYVKALLKTEYFERYVAKESKGGTQKFLSLGNIRNFPMYMPSDEQLHKFSKTSNALIQVQNSLDNSRFKLDKLLSSLQHSLMFNN